MVYSFCFISVKTQQHVDLKLIRKMIVYVSMMRENGGGVASTLLLREFQTHLQGMHIAQPHAMVVEIVWGEGVFGTEKK